MKKALCSFGVLLTLIFSIALAEPVNTPEMSGMPAIRIVFIVIAVILLIASVIIACKAVFKYRDIKANEKSLKDKAQG